MILNEEKIIRKQLIKNMIYNFVVFTAIFTVFGILIFNTVKVSVYESSNRELNIIKELFDKNIADRDLNRPKDFEPSKTNQRQPIRKEVSLRVTYILRDKNYQIINSENLGRIYEEYGASLVFDQNNLGNIYEIEIGNQYSYRGMNLKTTNEAGEVQYIQLLINTDAEKAIMENYFKIILIGIMITIELSLIASYLISKKSLEPILASWKKQTEFVQNASHELRTPLTIIQAKQELLLQQPNSKIIDRSEDIMLTLNEAKRLSKMTKDLMLLARADSDRIEIQKEEVDLDKVIKEIALPYIDFAQVEEKEIELRLEYKEKIKIDRNKIHQLLVIILDNAIKYTKPKDKIEICTYHKDNKCVIEVKDTGIGISEEAMKHVFERFYREDKARSRKAGGTRAWIINCRIFSCIT